MNTKKLYATSLLLLSSLVLMQCNDTFLQDDEDGRIQITMFDEPAEYESVFVEIVSVEAHRQTGDQDSGWFTLSEDTVRTDLLELVAGNQEVLADTLLEPGTYQQIRLILGEDNKLVKDGQEFDLHVPSGQQTGIKLNVNAEIEPETTYALELDFDASRSIIPRGASGNYNLRPVIRVVTTETSGTIAGNVEPADYSGFVHATTEEDTVTTSTSDNGDFQLRGVPDGTWKVTAESTSDDYDDSEVEDVEVAAGETTDIGTIQLQPVQQ